ncbi:hypothetical protein [Delftia acidovorans]|uniref:hypothetical protein n=1 Tax=Delftia acidovorans TaxID=80866 RepID=UPI00286EBED7|nr:hypothetical protein [Delftia acidovorans]
MKLKCIGKNNVEREFDLEYSTSFQNFLEFWVSHEDLLPVKFVLVLQPLSAECYRVMMIDAHDAYGGCGIPDALLPFVANSLSAEIRSSQTMAPDGKTWRKPEATKMWKRLVNLGLAEYLEEEDFFRVI